jgi:RHS repeat-associated protein
MFPIDYLSDLLGVLRRLVRASSGFCEVLVMTTLKEGLCWYRYDALDVLSTIETVGTQELRRFYCREHLATDIQARRQQSVIRHGTQLLALQSGGGDITESQLLATDRQRSVFRVSYPEGPLHQIYTPYGHRRVECGLGSLLGFTGEAVDPVTGHYLLGNGHRAFNPVLMRFNSPDDLSPFGRGGLNPYAYCLGDPVNISDPTGRFAEVAKLFTSLIGMGNSGLGMHRSIPYKLAKDALQWGAVGQLPLKHTFGATNSTVAGVAGMVSAVTGVGSAIAGITGDAEAAQVLGFVALGLAALTVTARVGSHWAARDPKTIPSLKAFVERHKPVKTTGETPPASPTSLNAAGGFPGMNQTNNDTSQDAYKIRRKTV